MALQIKWLKLVEGAETPKKAHPTDAGMDMRVIITPELAPQTTRPTDGPAVIRDYHDPDLGTVTKGCLIYNNQTVIFHTGLKCAVPEGYYLEINPRSSLGFKKDLVLANTTGIIDSHYRGELMVAIHNNSGIVQEIMDGERVVQCMLKKVEDVENVEVNELDDTDRGEGGLGSSGTN